MSRKSKNGLTPDLRLETQDFLNSQINIGAPISAVIAPTGSSRGAIAVRATVYAKTTKIAPAIAEKCPKDKQQ